MSTKTKTTAAAAIAALALPAVALADGSDRPGKHGQERAAEQHKKHEATHVQKTKGKAFVIKGVDAAGLTVTDGALAGALTLDPTSANKHARTFLDLTKTELRGEDTVSFGEAGDKVVIKYVGLQPTDALQPTDVVKVLGKVSRKDGKLDIRKIQVKRETAETEAEKTEAEKTESKSRKG